MLGVLIPFWLLFGPVPLGGSSSYVTTSGISMVPLFHGGDLAIVRETSEYRVGDIAAYRDHDIGQVVLHRIVAMDGDRYVFQGDNNDFLDSYHPDRADVVGKLWLHVPRAGRLLAWMGTQRNAALLGGILGLFVVGGFSGVRAQRRRRRRRQQGGIPRVQTPALAPRREPLPGLATRRALAVLSASTVALVALGALAFSRPLDTSSSTSISYEQHGAFSYSAPGPPGPVYGGEALSTGDPVFLRLVRQIQVRFAYRFDAAAAHEMTGTIGLSAELTDPIGWTHVIGIQPATAFQGDEIVTSGPIELASLSRLIAEVQRRTELPQSQYTLTLVADVRMNGALAGEPVASSFSPQLRFVLVPNLMRLDETVSATTAEPPADPLSPSGAGSVAVRGMEESRLTAFDHSMSTATARRIAVWGAAVSLVALLVVAALAFFWRPKDEPARIRAKYGNRLIPVETTEGSGAVVDVASIKALAMVAERHDGMILALESEGVHSYMVEGEVVMYRYRSLRAGVARLPIRSGERNDSSVAPAVERNSLRIGQDGL